MGSAAPIVALLMVAVAWTSASALQPAPRDLPAPLPPALPVVPGLNSDFLDDRSAGDFAAAGHDHDERYYTEHESDGRFAAARHDHDERYYTEHESDGRFLGAGSKAADAELLDGLDSTAFAPVDHVHAGAGGGVAIFSGATTYGVNINPGTWYFHPFLVGGNFIADELGSAVPLPASGKLTGLRVWVRDVNLDAGNSLTLTVRVNQHDTPLTVSLDADANDVLLTSDAVVPVHDGDLVSLQAVAVGLPDRPWPEYLQNFGWSWKLVG